MQLSPNVSDNNNYEVPEALEQCIDNAPEYLPCSHGEQTKSANFVHNAEVNLGKIRKRFQALNDTEFPPELRPVVAYYRDMQTAFLGMEEKRLRYLQSGDTEELSGSVGGVDTTSPCAPVRRQIQTSIDATTAWNLVSMDWHNCVNRVVRQQIGPFPKAGWEKFLQHYSIEELFVPREVN
jgi:hypothetical protein